MKLKKLLSLALLCGMVLTAGPLTSCASSDNTNQDETTTVKPIPSEPIENDSGLPKDIKPLGEPGIQVHYQRMNGSYKDWTMWLWAEGKDGAKYPFNYQDDYGVIAYHPLSTFGNPKSLGFIVRKTDSWDKDVSDDRFMDIDMLEKDENDCYHIYIRSGLKDVFTDKERQLRMNAIKLCEFKSASSIYIEANNPIKDPVVRKNGEVFTNLSMSANKSKTSRTIQIFEAADVSNAYDLDIEFEADGKKVSKNVSIRKLYNEAFDKKYFYDGDLGAIYSKTETTFRVWSPISKDIKLRIYENGTPKAVSEEKGDDTYTETTMVKNSEKGIFEATLSGDLEGKYYTYVVTNGYYKEGREIVDPYAKACGVNGRRGMVVDFSKTNPDGWNEVGYSQIDRKKLTVYETHVSDLSSSTTWNGTDANRKKFLGMIESGTTYTDGDVTVKTGFDHIKELGVNAIQVIPFFDGSNDEVDTEFNWGYNPLNYNCIEGAYSSNPYDGYVRINELKQVIMAYKQAGIAFIMDVVYNHVAGLAGSNFDVLMPFYYFRYTETGGATSSSGCGNDTASERYMYKKFMIDSTEFWTKEFKLDGFRFDLMGIHTLNTMNDLVANLKTINSNITVYGEPWFMGAKSAYGDDMAVQDNASKYNGYGQFNDQGRNSILSGGLAPVESKAYMNDTKTPVGYKNIIKMINSITSEKSTDDPDKTVTYVTCHDNYTLADRSYAAGIYDEALNKKSAMLANGLVMTSLGTGFMLSGEELLRTKIEYDEDGKMELAKDKNDKNIPDPFHEGEFIHKVSGNSYASSYKTNEIDWSLKVKHQDLFEYYQKLLWLKQNASDLALSKGGRDSSTTFKAEALRNGTVIHTTFANGNDKYDAYFGAACLYNYKNDSADPFNIDLTGKSVYIATDHSDVKGNSLKLNPYEVVIIKNA